MINSNLKRKNLISPESASIFLPVIISALFSVFIISVFVIPQYIKSNKTFFELKEFIRKKDDLQKLKGEYILINQKLKRLSEEKIQIIELISGKTNLETFLSRLGNVGKRNNIKFLSIIPNSYVKYIPPVETVDDDLLSDLNVKVDPLLVDGVKKYEIYVQFLSSFQDLLLFLKDIEFQENIILLSDINIQQNDNEQQNEEVISDNIDLLKTSIKMSVYGKV